MAESWHQRYLAGEHRLVWTEMQNAGPIQRGTPLEQEMLAVVHETMSRVRRNVELLVERLQAAGYEFVDPAWDDGAAPRTPWIPPDADSPAFAEWLGTLVGGLPASVVAWITQVGDVNLVGNHPDWPEPDEQTDALVVEFELKAYLDRGQGYDDPRAYFEGELNGWAADVAEFGAQAIGPFTLTFAPDSYHKINVSGGESYGIYVPAASADGVCRIEGRDILFIDYLRECFRCGGFPGAPSLPGVEALRRDLLAF